MEIRINKEIRNYKESMFFGLSMRQFIFSGLAMGVAVLLYFGLKPYVGAEAVSWICILGAAPFAAMGFFTYHGMTAEQFLWVLIRFSIREPRSLKFSGANYYEQAIDARHAKNKTKKKQEEKKGAHIQKAKHKAGKRRI